MLLTINADNVRKNFHVVIRRFEKTDSYWSFDQLMDTLGLCAEILNLKFDTHVPNLDLNQAIVDRINYV